MSAEYLAPLAEDTRDLADKFEEAGYVEWPDFLRAIASIVAGDCPVHGRDVGWDDLTDEERAEFAGNWKKSTRADLAALKGSTETGSFPIDGREVNEAPGLNVYDSPLLLTPAQQIVKAENARFGLDTLTRRKPPT
ncbi:MAG: hypothetical protein GEU74_12335 [Nitriliruptorales bacterium]|nr:hypothetical protein [Nitriliruptorales bacterium]